VEAKSLPIVSKKHAQVAGVNLLF